MCKTIKILTISVLLTATVQFTNGETGTVNKASVHDLYTRLFPEENKPTYEAFVNCLEGFQKLKTENMVANSHIVTLIDYTKPSNVSRLWVIDMENETVVHNSLVAHGRNSGEVLPTKFSNTPHSLMSSQGFFITGESYVGKHGYSLRLDGAEPGINDLARQRAIVIHSAQYATTSFIQKYGRLGRSWGCPALPPSVSKNIIDLIKEKSCIYIYSPDPDYASKSDII